MSMEGNKTPRGLRNCNPGNIRNSSETWRGEIVPSADKSFKQFRSMAYGYRALIKMLRNYRLIHGCRTVADFIRRWAPETENNTSGYIRRVCKELQVPHSYVPDIDDKPTMCAFAAAISLVENGMPATMEEVSQGWDLLFND